MNATRTRRRKDIEQELEEAVEPNRPAASPPAEQLVALQRYAGNQAVTRMLDTGLRSRAGAPERQELARRAADDGHLESAIRAAAGLRSAALSPMPAGTLQDPSQGSGPDLLQVGPGMLLGEGDDEVATPGVTAPEADAQIATVEGPEDAATAAANPVAASPDAAPDAAPSTAEETAPEAASSDAAAPTAAPAALVINSRTDMHANDGSPDTRRKIGMGEVVYFDVGGAVVDWTASAGWPPARKGRSTFAWELPTPGTATITATDPATGATASIDMEVVAPDELKMKKFAEDPQPAGQAGAGMWLRPQFGPRAVNFGNVEWLEVPGPASGVTGYFADMAATGVDLSHHPNPTFLRIQAGLNDHAAFLGLPSPYKVGGFFWDIPNSFRRAATGGAGITTVHSTQTFHIDAAGAVTVTKGGASVTRSP